MGVRAFSEGERRRERVRCSGSLCGDAIDEESEMDKQTLDWERLYEAVAAEKLLEERQLLELMLGFGMPDDLRGAEALLKQFKNVWGILNASSEALSKLEDLSEDTRMLLRLLRRVLCLRKEREERERLNSLGRWIEFLWPLFFRQRRELVYLLCMSWDYRLRACVLLTRGDDQAAQIDLRQVCDAARDNAAEAVVLAHNHPGGVAVPSFDDVHATNCCLEALAKLNIRLLDHLVFTDKDCVSVAQSWMMEGQDCERGKGRGLCPNLRW